MISFNDFNLTGRLREDSKLREEAQLERDVKIFKKAGLTNNQISRYLDICAEKYLEVADDIEEMVFDKN